MPENAGKVQVGGKFRKGQSGNPNGKTKGTKNRTTLAAELLLRGEIEGICRSLIQEALAGNMQAIKMVLDRILPCRKDYPVVVDLPELKNATDALQAIAKISTAVGSGEISPEQGEALSRIVDVYVRAIEVHDCEMRISRIEEKTAP